MPKKREGWEKTLFQGPAGVTAPTLILHATDIELDAPVEYSKKTSRGDGTKVPRADRGPVEQDVKISFKMNENDGDASLTALVAAAANPTPTPRAIKYVDPVVGTVFDGDCYIKFKDNGSMGSAGLYEFEALATMDGGRQWILAGTSGSA